MMKKYSEIFNSLEDFLYTRELNLNKMISSMNLKAGEPQISSKKMADVEVLNRFLNLSEEKEKYLIVNIPLKYSKKAQNQEREDKFIGEAAEKLVIQEANLQIDDVNKK